MWADMAEWLVLHGARKVIISSDSVSQSNYINRRLSLLQSYFNADIIFAPNKAQTKDGAAEIISEVYFLGPIQSVYLLPNKNGSYKASDMKSLQYIDTALRSVAPKATAMNFVENAVGLFQSRIDAGFPTYNVQWTNSLEFRNSFHVLDNILNVNLKNIFIKNEAVSDSEQETNQALYKSTFVGQFQIAFLISFYYFRINVDFTELSGRSQSSS